MVVRMAGLATERVQYSKLSAVRARHTARVPSTTTLGARRAASLFPFAPTSALAAGRRIAAFRTGMGRAAAIEPPVRDTGVHGGAVTDSVTDSLLIQLRVIAVTA